MVPEDTECVEFRARGGEVVKLSPEDADLICDSWRIGRGGYASRNAPRPRLRGATHIWLHKEVAKRLDIEGQVDHRNRNRLDNRRSNLRAADHGENMRNISVHKDNKAGLKGVETHKNGGYTARIQAHGVRYYLGHYRTAEEAHLKYCEAAARLHGDFATSGERK